MAEWKCEICDCLKEETPRAYIKEKNMFQMDLCNRHYIQMHRHGRITDGDKLVKKSKYCEICGDTYGVKKIGFGKYKNTSLCAKHYSQVHQKGLILDDTPSHLRLERVCEVCDSTDDVIFSHKVQKMLCRRHYDHIYNYGEILERTVFDRNEIVECGNYAEILLYDSNHKEVDRTMIDIGDIGLIEEYKWRGSKDGYVSTSINGKHTPIHRLIMGQHSDIECKLIDHIDRNPLNNRKENLRVVGKSINAINTGLRTNNKSGVTGVCYSNNLKQWRAYINYNNKRIELGYCDDIKEAIALRLNAEKDLYGKYAPQIHLFKKYNIKDEVI